MKRVFGSAAMPKAPNSGGPVAQPVDSVAFEVMIDAMGEIVDQLKLTNELLKDIAK